MAAEVKVVKSREQIVAEQMPAVRISRSKLRAKDPKEIATFLYNINPLKFERIAAAQGVAVRSEEDARALFQNSYDGTDPFNVKRFLRTIKFSAEEIAKSGKRITGID